MLKEDLSTAESAVVQAIEANGLCVLRSQRDDAEARSSPATWVSGAFISQLILRPEALLQTVPASLTLGGLRIRGEVAIHQASAPAPISFHGCWFDNPFIANGLDGRDVDFDDCRIPDVDLSEVRLDGSVTFVDCVVDGGISLFGSVITGALLVSQTSIRHRDGVAIGAFGATIENAVAITDTELAGTANFGMGKIGASIGIMRSRVIGSPRVSVNLSDTVVDHNVLVADCTLMGTFDLRNCKIGQDIRISKTLLSAAHVSIAAQSLVTGGDFTFGDGSSSYGAHHLVASHIGGSIDLAGGSIIAPGAVGFRASSGLVEGDVRMNQDTLIAGSLAFERSEIRGALVASHARFVAPAGDCQLALSGAEIARGVVLHGVEIGGQVNANSLNAGRTVQVRGCSIFSRSEPAVTIDNASITGNVLVIDGSVCSGGLTVSGTTITGQFVLMESELTARTGLALEISDTTVTRTLLLQDDMRIRGGIALARTKAGTAIAIANCNLADVPSLDLSAVKVNGDLILQPTHSPKQIDLRGATVDEYNEPRACWSQEYLLDGFTYRRHVDAPNGANPKALLDWLKRDIQGFSPHPYEACARALENDGHREHARYVLMEKARTAGRGGSRFGRGLSFLAWALAGGGYRPRRALGWFTASLIIAAVLFSAIPVSDLQATRPDEVGPSFSSWGYATDVLLPIIDLKQTDSWTATGAAMPIFWLFTLWGWILTTAIAATVTTLVSRE